MRRFIANRFVLATLVLLAVAAVFGLAWISRPAALAAGRLAAGPSRAVVSSAVRACPAPGSAGVTAGGVGLAAVATGTVGGQAAGSAGGSSAGSAGGSSAGFPGGQGQAVVSRLGSTESTGSTAGSASGSAASAPLASYTQPGRLALTTVHAAPVLKGSSGSSGGKTGGGVPTGPGRGGVLVRATGSMARGLDVEQTGHGNVPTARCSGPGTDFWFVGPGQHSVAHIELYLMNTDSVPADASVSVLTDSGPLLGSTDTGITVPPHCMVEQSLDHLLRRSRVVALHVSTNIGRVVAAVRETRSAAEPGGWLPVAEAPATTQVLPGLPGTPGGGELYVAVPGSANAQVKVTAITPKGSYRPTGGSGIDLPGGSAVGIALPSLGGVPAAVRLTSNVPVTAAMMVPGGASGAPGAFAGASGAVQQQGVVAVSLARPAGASELVVSAPAKAAQVRVSELTTSGGSGPAGQLVSVPAGHSVVVRLRRPAGAVTASARAAPFAVVVTPLAGSGPVYAGRVLSVGGTVQSILPVVSSLSWVPLPRVNATLQAALP